MHQIFERHKTTKCCEGEIDHRNSPMSIKIIESIIHNLLKKRKYQAQIPLLVNSTKHLKKKWYQFLTMSSRKYKQEKHFLIHSMRPALL